MKNKLEEFEFQKSRMEEEYKEIMRQKFELEFDVIDKV